MLAIRCDARLISLGLISLVKKHSEAILGTVDVDVTATPLVRQVFWQLWPHFANFDIVLDHFSRRFQLFTSYEYTPCMVPCGHCTK